MTFPSPNAPPSPFAAYLAGGDPVREFCREWPEGGDRCNQPAELILWGKLFPPEALGPRCYDHAAKHIGHGWVRDSAVAAFDLRGLTRARTVPPERDESPAIEWQDVRRGDVVSLLVMDRQEGLNREHRRVVAVAWPKLTLAEGERLYEFDATKKHRLNEALRLESRAAVAALPVPFGKEPTA